MNTTPGLCGLVNLGNTCFMNSALQCLSNTPPLKEFITSDKYLNEINRTNKNGKEGRIADRFGELIKKMWSGTVNSLLPLQFKDVIGEFRSQFRGSMQQDSQELMAVLLDGLHEDLNRITNNTVIAPNSEVDTRSDCVIAEEYWSNFMKNNDSIIVDNFYGLHKSTLVCTVCEGASAVFEAYSTLSVPIPKAVATKTVDMTFVPAVEGRVAQVNLVGLSIPAVGKMRNIAEAVADTVNEKGILGRHIDAKNLRVAVVYKHTLINILHSDMDYGRFVKDVVVYELTTSYTPVYCREVLSNGTKELFGVPFFIEGHHLDYKKITEAVGSRLENYYESLQENVGQSGDKEMVTISLSDPTASIHYGTVYENTQIKLESHIHVVVVDIPTKIKDKYYNPNMPVVNVQRNKQQNNNIQLTECIKNFTTTETLTGNESWNCATCKRRQPATKTIDLCKLPNIMVIHLKRFSNSINLREKIDTFVEFPITGLNMGPYIVNNPDMNAIYDLIAVSNHFGGLGGGHYTACAKNFTTKKWYSYNDANVTPITEKNVISEAAYVLLYQKRAN